MTRLISWLSLAVVLSGCSLSKKAEIEIRAVALRHAFVAETAKWEWEGKKWTEITQWIFVVECDQHAVEVIKSLSDYPVVGERLKTRGERAFVEPTSGKSVAFLWVKSVTPSKDGAYLVDVGCAMGALHGYGQIVRLQKVAGRWRVVSSTPTWIS